MRWIWIDRIVELDADHCVAVKNVSLAEEHLHDHFSATADHPAIPVMPASLIVEGMAQTAGIMVGHARRFAEKVILAKIGRAEFELDVRPGQTLIYSAVMERLDESGASTSGRVEVVDSFPADAEPRPVGKIELMFSHVDQNMRGLAFPDHNFVFTAQFMDLLRNSGFAEAIPPGWSPALPG
ncbi:MAG: beta-hydroxyacyl-ACP dehydratase [Phycisphaerae bacterium]|nr:beta-hydroxyacyl-ACP dehydratase [Phycisphaerae bacterium]